MSESQTTVVLSPKAERNAVKMIDVDRVKSMRANKDGRFYLSRDLAGEWAEFAVARGSYVAADEGDDELGEDEHGDVLLYDVERLDRKRILGNGHLHIGERFKKSEVTVALKVVEPPQEAVEQAQQKSTKANS